MTQFITDHYSKVFSKHTPLGHGTAYILSDTQTITVQYSTVHYSPVQYSALQSNTVQCSVHTAYILTDTQCITVQYGRVFSAYTLVIKCLFSVSDTIIIQKPNTHSSASSMLHTAHMPICTKPKITAQEFWAHISAHN